MIYGTVRDDALAPAGSVEVRAEWMEFSGVPQRMIQRYEAVTTGADGKYRFCFLPVDFPVTLKLSGKGFVPSAVEVRIPRNGVLFRDLR